MKAIDSLRKIIREEVEKAIRKELPLILKENLRPSAPVDYKNSLQESMAKPPSTLNTNRPSKPKFDKSNPFSFFLNETVDHMNTKDLSALGVQGVQEEPVKVGSVDEMLSSTRPTSNIEAVEIDVVPDFSSVMESMKSKGLI